MKRLIFFVPILLFIGCDDDGSNEPDREKPKYISFERITVDKLGSNLGVSKIRLQPENPGSPKNMVDNPDSIKTGSTYSSFTPDSMILLEDSYYKIGVVRDDNFLFSERFNVWERIKDTEVRNDGIQTINIDAPEMIFTIVVKFSYRS